jgi:dihydrodipicolinate synthase/N-acetylneuraminate lyase
MKTSAVTAADFSASVFSVPPLARRADLSLDFEANRKLIRHIEAGGVHHLLYGGNANLYHIEAGEFAELLGFLAEAASPDSWVIPAIGPDYGKMRDQARVLRDHQFPTVLTLPMGQATHEDGVALGLARVADTFGRPLMLYIKGDGYIAPAAVGRLVREGAVCGIKYAIDRRDPREDAYLTALLDHVDRRIVVSGMGERPAVAHLQHFGLAGFTSGLVCISPAAAQQVLKSAQAGDFAAAAAQAAKFKPLEDAREKLGFIRVLQSLVRLADVADTGPLLPFLANLSPAEEETLKPLLATFLQATR